MLKAAFIVGFALILVGLGGFYASGRELTALIPGILGLLFVVCAVVSLRPVLRKHAMHGAILIALLGTFGAGMRLPRLMGAEDPSILAIGSHILTVLLCIGFFVLGIRSFIMARRHRKAANAALKEKKAAEEK